MGWTHINYADIDYLGLFDDIPYKYVKSIVNENKNVEDWLEFEFEVEIEDVKCVHEYYCSIKISFKLEIGWDGLVTKSGDELVTKSFEVIKEYTGSSPMAKYIGENLYYEDEDEDEDEEWDDISSCVLTYTKKNGIVSTELQMAGGGSHACWYVLEWSGVKTDPKVFIRTLKYKKQSTNQTLIVRHLNEYGCEGVKLVDSGDDLPDDNDDYTYHKFHISDDIYNMDEDETDEES